MSFVFPSAIKYYHASRDCVWRFAMDLQFAAAEISEPHQQGFAFIVSKLRDVFMEHAMMVNEKVNCMYAVQLKIIY